MNAVRILDEPKQEQPLPRRHLSDAKRDRFKKRYGLMLIGLFALAAYTMILCCVTGTIVHHNDMADLEQEKTAAVEAYKQEQAQAEQAAHWLSGDASRDAAINQAVDAVAPVIAKLSNDQQKLTEASCMLARVMNPAYPDNFQEVASQPQQWMFFDGSDLTCTQHDRDLAESIIRPYMESGIVPNGLTSSMVYGEWTPNDFCLRDSYKTTSTMRTWRYS